MWSSVVAALVSPLGFSLLLGVLALGLALRGGLRQRVEPSFRRQSAHACVACWLGVLALAWLWVWSTPLASEALRGQLEEQAGPRALQDVTPAQTMVVLGGGTRGERPPLRQRAELTAAADSLWHAARLYHAGKAKRLLLSGGATAAGNGTEAAGMRQVLQDLGVPAYAMSEEVRSHDTASKARRAAQMLLAEGTDTVILVTSALHMPRARQLFESQGLRVHPAPTGFEVVPMPMGLQRLLPDAASLDGSSRGLREWLGWAG